VKVISNGEKARFWKEWSWLGPSYYSPFPWSDREKPRRISTRTPTSSIGIRTAFLLNKGLENYQNCVFLVSTVRAVCRTLPKAIDFGLEIIAGFDVFRIIGFSLNLRQTSAFTVCTRSNVGLRARVFLVIQRARWNRTTSIFTVLKRWLHWSLGCIMQDYFML
jgi:hypothetical protein